MDSVSRLQLLARITYYAGWIALACGGLVHFSVAKAMFTAMNMTKRNLFEVGVALFLISIASAARAIASGSGKSSTKG